MAISDQEIRRLEDIARQTRKDIVDVTEWAGGAHIGGALSMVEILVILYHRYLNVDPANPEKPDRDRFILSKGHCGVGHAPVLARNGFFDFGLLQTFNQFKSPFGMHAEPDAPHLPFPGVRLSEGDDSFSETCPAGKRMSHSIF